jgi:hypothetical protein
VFVLGHRFGEKKKKKKTINIKPTDETRYFLSWVHKTTISVHFTDIMLGFSCHIQLSETDNQVAETLWY